MVAWEGGCYRIAADEGANEAAHQPTNQPTNERYTESVPSTETFYGM